MRALLIVVLSLTLSQKAAAENTIKVGGYLFPPFIEIHSGVVSGLTVDLIDLLNTQQSEYVFELVLTSPKRRYIDFKREKIDALFFENKRWGWQEQPISASQVFLSGGEVYITKNTPDKNQHFFDELESKSLAAILGYHYQFANYRSEESFLKNNFTIELLSNPDSIINKVLSERVQVGIVTQSYLSKEIARNPNYKHDILISEKMDQIYSHTILIRDDSSLPIKVINRIIEDIKLNGTLNSLLTQYGLSQSPRN